MPILELLTISISLSMDAFAASLCKGLCLKKFDWKVLFSVSGIFGLFQGLMPLLGWFIGKQFASFVSRYDHWVAFFILSFIAIKMIIEGLKSNKSCVCETDRKFKDTIMLGFATSIDAFAIGISFAFLVDNIFSPSLIIGLVTFIITSFGVIIGFRFGDKLKNKAEVFGGVALLTVGFSILLTHLFGG